MNYIAVRGSGNPNDADGEFLPESMQNTSDAYQGPKYFSYEGKSMWQMRLECEDDK